MGRPNFIICGTQRCGTSSLWKYLLEHPKIDYIENKKMFFLGRNYVPNKSVYESLFPEKKKGHIVGESTPGYINSVSAPTRIHDMYGKRGLNFICLLRNPVERSHSHWKLERKRKREPLDNFEDAVSMEPIRLHNKAIDSHDRIACGYISKGLYANHLENWLKYFKLSNFLFIKSGDLFFSTQKTYNKITNWIGLKNHKLKDKRIYNFTDNSKVEPEFRKRLVKWYKSHNEKLYKMIKIDYKWR